MLTTINNMTIDEAHMVFPWWASSGTWDVNSNIVVATSEMHR
jgi:hypothetical protein